MAREDEIRAALTMSPRAWTVDVRRILAAPSFAAAKAIIILPSVVVAPPTREIDS